MRLIRWVSFAFLILFSVSFSTAAQTGTYTVQLEAAPTQAEADEKVRQLKAKGVEAYVLKSTVAGKGTFYRVRVGMFPNANEARKFGASLQRQGKVQEFFIAPFERGKDEVAATSKSASKPAPAAKTPPSPQVNQSATLGMPTTSEPAKEPIKNSEPAKPIKSSEPPKEVAKTDPPKSAGNATSSPSTSTAPATTANFTRFQDPQIGFSFEYPSYWTGNSLSADDAKSQRINAGALFKSPEDSAFLNAIWNELDKANSPTNDNDLIIDVILKSMRSGDGTQTMDEIGRKVVEDKERGQVKTYLDLRATFQTQTPGTPLEFIGKAVIIRASRGILLVATFYSKNGPATVASVADKIISSVKAPE